MASVAQDLWYALRLMRKRPGVTAIAVLTLALGVGANTAIFSVVNGVLLKPLPYSSSSRLVHVTIAANTGFGDRTSLPMSDFLAWQAANRSCEALTAYTTNRVVVSGAGDAEQVVDTTASAAFFETLGVRPTLGRLWQRGDDRPGAPLTVVVSHAFWARRLHADRGAIGQPLVIDGQPHDVIGVAPAGFAFPGPDVELWSILRLDPPMRRGPYFLRGLGLLKVGASIPHVQADLRRAQSEVRNRFPSRDETRYRVEPLDAVMTGDVRPALLLVTAAVTLVLLIAMANVANLLLVGAAERERELAVRAALGAGRRRLLTQLLVEGLVLAAVGAAAGWVCAIWATRALVAFSPPGLPRLDEIQMDSHVFGFTLVAAVVSGIVLGAVPALHVSDRGLLESVQSGLRSSARPAARRFRNGLVVGEIALALTVAVVAALLGKSLARLQHVASGITAEHVVTASVVPPAASYPRGPRLLAVFDDLLRRVETVPGVVASGVTNSLPPDGLSLTDSFLVEDRLPPPDQGAPVAPLLVVSEDYFRALRIPLVRGRWFNRFDTPSSTPVTIISEAMAKEHFAGLDPIGRRLKNASDPRSANPWRIVVGIVADVKYAGLAERADPAFYVPLPQAPSRDEYLVVRTSGDPASVVSGIREALHSMDPDLPIADIRTLDERLWESTGPARFRAGVMALFGVMGLILAAIGMYSVIAYSVTQRRRELGVRMALGATKQNLLRMVVGETVRLASIGTAVGLVLALAAGRVIAALLFAVSPSDSFTFIGMTTVLMLVALASGLLPAWRAATTDPMVALRAE
jgi:putative ABC transport system permease protein